MILTIPGGAQQNWGDAVLLQVSGILVTANQDQYNVLLKIRRMEGVTPGAVILNSVFWGGAGGTAYMDISPYIKEIGTYRVEWGEQYLEVFGANEGNWVTTWFDLDKRIIEIINTTSVVIGGVTIPKGAVQLSGNPVEIRVKATGLMMAGKVNYRLALKITCPALMGSPFIETIAPDSTGMAIFDISGFVDQPVEHTFDYPAKGACNPHDPLIFRITLDTGEVYVNAAGERMTTWAGDMIGYQMRIVKGRLRPYELALLNEIGKSFNSEYIKKGKFLTHLPNFQKVGPRHVPMLWYLSRWTENHAITAHLKINTADKVAHIPMTQNFTLWDITGLVDFAFQPQFWGYVLNSLEQIVSYEFWLSDINGDISEHRTYLVDNGYYERSFTFYYLNPLSGIDMIWLTGEHTEGLKTEAETAYRPVPFGSGSKVPSLTTVTASGQPTWELNTGIKTREELRGLRDFLEARQRWMVDPDNENRLIPVVIESGDFSFFDSMADVQSFGIKIMEAH